MADEESTNNKIADVANAVAAVAKEIPIYQDALQPAAQEIGMALKTVAKLVNVALAPVSALVWGYDQIREFTATKVAEKLKGVPPENIVTPHPNVAGPAIEALRYTGHEELLSEMYASLLATAMNKDTIQKAHPAFVDIIKQLVLRNFSQIGERAGCDYVQFVPAYLDNLVRMGLWKISEGIFYSTRVSHRHIKF